VVLAILLAGPLAIRVLAAAAARAPFAARLALRDLARYQARSGAALAAISLALGIAVAAVVAAAAAEHTAGEGNLSDRQLLLRVGDAEPLIPERSAAELARLRSEVDRLAATLDHPTVLVLDAAVDPEVEEGRDGRVVRPPVMLGRPVGEHTLRHVGMLYVATPELLHHLGLGRAPAGPGTDVLTPHGGDLRFANLARPSEAAPDTGKETAPAVETIDVPAYTSAPVSLLTTDGLRRGGWQPARAGWLVVARNPPTGAQLAQARQVAADAGMTLETRDEQTELTVIRSAATVAGMLLALGILAMTVGLIRGEATGDLRTLTAAGATATTRRNLTAATSGALALLGVVLGTAGAYLALLAGYHNDLVALGRVPVGHLTVTLVGLPLTAAAAGWLLAGRAPPTLARQPLE
jgi:putative ABC transport system permease protein